MLEMFIYTIIAVALFVLVVRLMLPFLWIFLVAYLIYYIYRWIRYRQVMKQLKKAKEEFEDEWNNVTSSEPFQSSSNQDVIDADFTVREDHDDHSH